MADAVLGAFANLGSGTIPKAKLKSLLQELDAQQWTNEIADNFLETCGGVGKDGQVNVAQFLKWLWSDSGESLAKNMVLGQAGMARSLKAGAIATGTEFEGAGNKMPPKTKIICTMGPSCWDVENLVKMIDAGLNICRLNFSHGDHEGHGATVNRIREAAAQRPDKHVAILLDTKGPEIRTGFFREDCGGKIDLEKGQDLKLVIDYGFKGDNTCFALSYDALCKSVKPGNTILCADGSLSLKVKSVADDHVMTEVMNSVKLGERKNCNLPGVKVDLPVLQEKDKKDLIEFGIKYDVDFVAASFVQSEDDVKMIREVLGEAGKHIKIIPKIENEEGLKNFDEILHACDGIMVARGDLGMEIPPEKVFLAQKMMIAKCNLRGKPVITATQMLESMTSCPRPTRAEASDVANAVLDGTDCTMLSGETAGGSYPLNAVSIMRAICDEAEHALDYPTLFNQMRGRVLEKFGQMRKTEAVSSSAVKNAIDSSVPLLVTVTDSGHTAKQLAKYRPQAPIIAVSHTPRVLRQLAFVRGVTPLLAPESASAAPESEDFEICIKAAIDYAKEQGFVKGSDPVIAIHSVTDPVMGHQNMLKMFLVQ